MRIPAFEGFVPWVLLAERKHVDSASRYKWYNAVAALSRSNFPYGGFPAVDSRIQASGVADWAGRKHAVSADLPEQTGGGRGTEVRQATRPALDAEWLRSCSICWRSELDSVAI